MENSNQLKSGRSRVATLLTAYGPSFILIAGLFALWQFCLPPSLSKVLPKPSVIISACFEKGDVLLDASKYTIIEATLGFLIGNAIAVIIAAWVIYSETAYCTIYPMAVVLKCIPSIGLTPFIVMIFGQGISAKVVIVALTCFFPTLINMIQGFTSVDKQALELMRTLDAPENKIFWKLRVPNSLPHLFTSFKITATASVLGAIIGEWMGAWHGLGAIIVQSMFNMQGDLLWACMLWSTVLSILAYLLIIVLEPICIPWHETVKNTSINGVEE